MKSPCKGYKNELEDKRKHPDCVACDLPIIYEKSLGCHSESVPIEVVKMSEKIEMSKACKNPACEHGGKPQPIDNFQIHGRSGSGQRIGVCRECVGRKISSGLETKKTKDKKEFESEAIETERPDRKSAASEPPGLPASQPPRLPASLSTSRAMRFCWT